MNLDKTAEIISDYIHDSRNKQAVLINGEWGSGKTFFVNQKLESKFDDYIVIKYSLYGIHSTEQIISDIQTQILLKVIGKKEFQIKNKKIHLPSKLIDNLPMAAGMLCKFIGFEADDLKGIIESFDFETINTLIIFDDLERTSVEINEVLGTINSFVECMKAKVIIIANEKEIGSARITTNLPEKYLVAANNNINLKTTSDMTSDTENSASNRYTYNELISRTKKLFSTDIVYNQIKEKLIGLSVTILADFDLIYDDIIKEYALDSAEFLLKHKEAVYEILQTTACQNIRTLIFAVISFDNLFDSIIKLKDNHTDIRYLNLLDEELIQIMRSVIYHSIIYKSGNEIKVDGSSFSSTCFLSKIKDLKEYSFVNKYIRYHEFDFYNVSRSVNSYIEMLIDEENNSIEAQKLSYYKLYSYNWLDLDDEDVIKYTDLLYEELEAGKYDVRYFKDIIILLLQLEFDFNEKRDMIVHSNNDYISLMVQYIRNNELVDNQEEIFEADFVDGRYKEKFNMYISLLINATAEKTNKDFYEAKKNIFNAEDWSASFFEFCKTYKDMFFHSHSFLSSFKIDDLKNALLKSNNCDINTFSRAVYYVYDFGNIRDYYQSDISALEEIIVTLDLMLIGEGIGCTRKINISITIEKLTSKLKLLKPDYGGKAQ